MAWDAASFKEKLENEHQFPGKYVFKFIVPKAYKEDVLTILPAGELSFRNSSNEQYTSITLHALMQSSDEVVAVYMNAYTINGIIAL